MDGGGRSLGARALLALISVGPMSRGDLGGRLGLSAATTRAHASMSGSQHRTPRVV